MQAQASAIVSSWTEALRAHGFDLVQSFDACSYNRSPRALGSDFRLPSFGQASALGLVVAHGAALWDVFVAAVRASETLRRSSAPLDQYTESVVLELQRATSTPSAAFFSHRTDPVIPIQRIAHVSGLAGLSPSHMSVHPRLGPWLGLRAVVVFQTRSDPDSALSPPVYACEGCAAPCLGALQRAQATPDSWQAWLSVRESCPVGRDARYSERQIRYHYTKDRTLLNSSRLQRQRKSSE